MTIFSRIKNLSTQGAFLETMKNVVLTTIPLLSEFMKLKYSHDLAVTSNIYISIYKNPACIIVNIKTKFFRQGQFQKKFQWKENQ